MVFDEENKFQNFPGLERKLRIEFEGYLWLFIQRSFTKYSTTNSPIGIHTAHAIPAAVPGDILPLKYFFSHTV